MSRWLGLGGRDPGTRSPPGPCLLQLVGVSPHSASSPSPPMPQGLGGQCQATWKQSVRGPHTCPLLRERSPCSKCHHGTRLPGRLGWGSRGAPPREPSAPAQEKERLAFFSADETGRERSVLPCQGSGSGLRFISHAAARGGRAGPPRGSCRYCQAP